MAAAAPFGPSRLNYVTSRVYELELHGFIGWVK